MNTERGSSGPGEGASAPRLYTLDFLRAAAALGVCWFHFTNGPRDFLPAGWLKSSGAFGWLGVEVFFVISGFIIPYALSRSGYQLADYGRFLLKRLIRLDPPYLVGLAVVIVLGYLSSSWPGASKIYFHPSLLQVALHFGYLNVFFGYQWLNPAYWTLAIELQYYVMAGLLFPALAHRERGIRALTFAGLGGLALAFPNDQFLPHWFFLFMLGMTAFQLHAKLLGRREFYVWVIVLGLGSWYVQGPAMAVTGVVTALLIALYQAPPSRPWLFLGRISYSLYLMHVPIGGRIVNLSQHFALGAFGKILTLAAALGISLLAAWLLERWVEGPAREWSARLRYRPRTAA